MSEHTRLVAKAAEMHEIISEMVFDWEGSPLSGSFEERKAANLRRAMLVLKEIDKGEIAKGEIDA